MTDLHLKTKAIAESDMQFMFPQSGPVAIAPAAIGKYEQTVGIWIMVRARL